ncbi:MAG: amidohydrolase family protein [Candidatus Sumerlaeia bacterium]
MPIIDMHNHLIGDHPDFIALLEEFDIKVMNISVAWGEEHQWRAQSGHYRELARRFPDRFAWCATFPPPRPEDEKDRQAYARKAIADLESAFDQGALACKFHKNIGMGIQKADGSFLMIDDPILTPIFDYLERRDFPAIMHIGEPIAAWMPITPGFPHSDYFARRRDYHWHGQKDKPSHAQILAARDRVIERYPRLKVIGAHLGSHEHDVDEVAARLEKYPNYAVDTSARLIDLMWQDQDKVRDFFLKYSDRILFGVDWILEPPVSTMTHAERKRLLENLRSRYYAYLRYFGTEEIIEYRTYKVIGLNLPEPILEKLYLHNAKHWIPGL